MPHKRKRSKRRHRGVSLELIYKAINSATRKGKDWRTDPKVSFLLKERNKHLYRLTEAAEERTR
jgi:hypothetical protein